MSEFAQGAGPRHAPDQHRFEDGSERHRPPERRGAYEASGPREAAPAAGPAAPFAAAAGAGPDAEEDPAAPGRFAAAGAAETGTPEAGARTSDEPTAGAGAAASEHPSEGPETGSGDPEADSGAAEDDGPRPLGVPRRPTGYGPVDGRMKRLEDADHLAVSGHQEVYEDVHRGLRETLAALDRPHTPRS